MTKEYNEILNSLLQKYSELFSSLFSINDEELNQHLMHYLFKYNYIVLMPDDFEKPSIFLGESSTIGGFSKYGFVQRGICRYPEQLYSTERKMFDENNSVVIYSSNEKNSILASIYEPLTELASVFYTEHNNLRLSQIKHIIEGTPKSASVLEQIFTDTFLNSKSVVVLKNKESLEDMKKIDFDVDYIAEKYQQSIQFYHNQILERLGINFTPHEKKERLIVDEVNSNNEITTSIKQKFIERIQKYFDKYNKIYNTNLKIVDVYDLYEEDDESIGKEEKEDDIDENILD